MLHEPDLGDVIIALGGHEASLCTRDRLGRWFRLPHRGFQEGGYQSHDGG